MSCLMINDIDAGLGRFGELILVLNLQLKLDRYYLCMIVQVHYL